MSDPQSIAAYLLAHYIITPDQRVNRVSLCLDETDNQYRLEVLVQIYLECHRIYIDGEMADVTLERYLECLRRVFISIGYIIETDTMPREDMFQIVPVIMITGKRARIIPYHPMMIRDMIVKNMGMSASNPELESIYNDSDRISELVVAHDMDATSDMILTLRFRSDQLN
jgi:hypothetical protein